MTFGPKNSKYKPFFKVNQDITPFYNTRNDGKRRKTLRELYEDSDELN